MEKLKKNAVRKIINKFCLENQIPIPQVRFWLKRKGSQTDGKSIYLHRGLNCKHRVYESLNLYLYCLKRCGQKSFDPD